MRYSVNCFLLALSVMFGCSEGRKEQAPAGDKDEASADATGSPTVSAAGLPTSVSTDTSIEATVTGTATEYKYALSHQLLSDCDGVTYGAFQSISTKLTISEAELGADGDKTVCIVGRNSAGTESQPELYRWKKNTVPAAEEPPKVTVPGIESSYNEASIVLTIKAENGATHYQYALKQGELDNCDDANYGDDISVTANGGKFTLSDLDNGDYTLCLRGKNGAKLQQEVSPNTFARVDPPEPESAGRLNITTSQDRPTSIYFASGGKGTPKITLSNKGGSDLEWRLEAAQAASWLKVGLDEDSMNRVNSADDDLISGTLSAGQDTIVYLRLGDVYKTDYVVGKKTATLKVHNVSGGDAPVSIDVNMVVPEVERRVSPTFPKYPNTMTLSGAQPKGKVMLHNAKGGNWAVKYQFKPLISGAELSKFNDIVSYQRLKTSDGKNTKYIEFSVDKTKLAGKPADYTASMWYCIVTNTSSKGTVPPTSICKDDRELQGGETTTLGNGIAFKPDYTTNVCEVFIVLVTK